MGKEMLYLQLTISAVINDCEFCRFRSQEFDQYRISEPTTITFCLKELRAILNFADALSLDMTINFETAGKYVDVDATVRLYRIAYTNLFFFAGLLYSLLVAWMFSQQISSCQRCRQMMSHRQKGASDQWERKCTESKTKVPPQKVHPIGRT